VYFVALDYLVPAEELDALRPRHVAWLERHYAGGLLLGSGKQVPRVGGVLLFDDITQEQLDAALADEPFVAAGLAVAHPTCFEPTRGPLVRLRDVRL
jgi:uncharacterized protein YciI